MSKRPADAPESAFAPLQRVTILAPHAMQGNVGSILSRSGGQGSFHVRLDGLGFVCRVDSSEIRLVVPQHVPPRYPPVKAKPAEAPKPQNLQDAEAPTSAPTATAVTTSSTTTPSETAPADFFVPGQFLMVKLLSKFDDNQGGWIACLETGEVIFLTRVQNLQDAEASASTPSDAVVAFSAQNLLDPSARASATEPADKDELAFAPGHFVSLLRSSPTAPSETAPADVAEAYVSDESETVTLSSETAVPVGTDEDTPS